MIPAFGWSVMAVYLAAILGLLALWPGCIASQSAQRVQRLLWWFVLGWVVLYILLINTDFLVLVAPDIWEVPALAETRRTLARWWFCGMQAALLLALWKHAALWPRRPVVRCAVLASIAGLVAVPLVLLSEVPRPKTGEVVGVAVYGYRPSQIYHWPDCPHYPKRVTPHWTAFHARSDAEAAGFRPAKNCDRPRPWTLP